MQIGDLEEKAAHDPDRLTLQSRRLKDLGHRVMTVRRGHMGQLSGGFDLVIVQHDSIFAVPCAHFWDWFTVSVLPRLRRDGTVIIGHLPPALLEAENA